MEQTHRILISHRSASDPNPLSSSSNSHHQHLCILPTSSLWMNFCSLLMPTSFKISEPSCLQSLDTTLSTTNHHWAFHAKICAHIWINFPPPGCIYITDPPPGPQTHLATTQTLPVRPRTRRLKDFGKNPPLLPAACRSAAPQKEPLRPRGAESDCKGHGCQEGPTPTIAAASNPIGRLQRRRTGPPRGPSAGQSVSALKTATGGRRPAEQGPARLGGRLAG